MIVVSCPPCWVAVDVNTLPTLPIKSPFSHCFRHGFDVAIHTVVKNENFYHVISPHCAWSSVSLTEPQIERYPKKI